MEGNRRRRTCNRNKRSKYLLRIQMVLFWPKWWFPDDWPWKRKKGIQGCDRLGSRTLCDSIRHSGIKRWCRLEHSKIRQRQWKSMDWGQLYRNIRTLCQNEGCTAKSKWICNLWNESIPERWQKCPEKCIWESKNDLEKYKSWFCLCICKHRWTGRIMECVCESKSGIRWCHGWSGRTGCGKSWAGKCTECLPEKSYRMQRNSDGRDKGVWKNRSLKIHFWKCSQISGSTETGERDAGSSRCTTGRVGRSKERTGRGKKSFDGKSRTAKTRSDANADTKSGTGYCQNGTEKGNGIYRRKRNQL